MEKTLTWLLELKTLSNQLLPCIQGWMISVQNLLSLWQELSTEYGFKYLLTNRLNQDCIENLFSVLRGKGGNRDNPNSQQFRHALAAAMVDAIMVQSDKSNCQIDPDKFLMTLTNLNTPAPSTVKYVSEPADALGSPSSTAVLQNDDLTLNSRLLSCPLPLPVPADVSATDNVLFYIAGYMALRSKGNVCSRCSVELTGELHGSTNELFFSAKQYQVLSVHGRGLTVPSPKLFTAVQRMENCYCTEVKHLFHLNKVRDRLLKCLLQSIEQIFTLCGEACHLQYRVALLFLNIGLHHSLKESTTSFCTSTKKKNRKMLKLSHL